jgi:hypothetical protein
MSANLSKLGEMEPLSINSTGLNSSTELPAQIFGVVSDSVGDLWFYAAILGIFLFLNFVLYRREENFGFDLARSLLISSAFSFFISTAVLLSGWVSTLYPIIWFGSLMFVSFLIVFNLKQKNQ